VTGKNFRNPFKKVYQSRSYLPVFTIFQKASGKGCRNRSWKEVIGSLFFARHWAGNDQEKLLTPVIYFIITTPNTE